MATDSPRCESESILRRATGSAAGDGKARAASSHARFASSRRRATGSGCGVRALCARCEACTKFYRDGLGMREVESADGSKGALLEWAGCYLRLRKVPGERPTPASGNPMKQMLSEERLPVVLALVRRPGGGGPTAREGGLSAPTKGGNVGVTHNPDGNVVEIVRAAQGAFRRRRLRGAWPSATKRNRGSSTVRCSVWRSSILGTSRRRSA